MTEHATVKTLIYGELVALAEKVCTCDRLGDGGPHAYLCPTRQIEKRIDRLRHLDATSPGASS